METISGWFAYLFTPLVVKHILTLLGLILFQLILAVALSFKERTFDWKKLADFYKSMVLPYLIGWLGFIILARLVSVELLGPEYSALVADGVTWLAWLVVVSSLGARIWETLKTLYGNQMPVGERKQK